MIEIKDLSFQYKGTSGFALKDLNLTIKRGEFVGIIGSSGAGKTSLARAIQGVIPHHFTGDFYGCVTVDGLDTVDTGLDALSRKVGSVFQDIDSQMVTSLVEDEMLFGLESFSIPRDEIESRLEEALDALGIGALRHRAIASLSGGQKQKVAIAAILALRPDVLVLDEPTGELDPKSSRNIFRLLGELNRKYGMTIVVVEQKIMLLCEFSQRLIVMQKGRACYDGPVREVLANSRELEAIGVNCPRVVTLSRQLEEAGLYTGPTPLHVEEARTMVEEVLA